MFSSFSLDSFGLLFGWIREDGLFRAGLLSIFLLTPFVLTSAQSSTSRAVLATVGDRQITEADVDATVIAQLLPLQQQIYAIRKAALENLIAHELLAVEAKKRGLTLEALRKELSGSNVEVTVKQVESLYDENSANFAAMNADEAKERLRLDAEAQARLRNYRNAVAGLRKAARVEVNLPEPRLPRSLPVRDAPTRGKANAAVTILEFSDFECPYCREAQPTIERILKDFPNAVRVGFKHLPLEMHTHAFASARAAFCAGEQNKFWQYHDALFSTSDLSVDSLNRIAASLGFKQVDFKDCLASDRSRSAVMKDLQEARRLGINSTPTFIINGKIVRGAIGYQELKELIEQELRTAPQPVQTASQEDK